MQAVRSIVDGESIGRSIESEASARDPVAVPPDDCSEIWAIVDVALQIVVTEHNVVEVARAIWRPQRSDDSSIIRQAYFYPVRIGEGKELSGAPIRGCPEWRTIH